MTENRKRKRKLVKPKSVDNVSRSKRLQKPSASERKKNVNAKSALHVKRKRSLLKRRERIARRRPKKSD
jgi:hypothetical protein